MGCNFDIQEVISRVTNQFNQGSGEGKLSSKDVKKWKGLGFCETIAQDHPDCARFLLSTGLAFQIAMFQNSSNTEAFAKDTDNHPMLKMNGQYTRWDTLNSMFDYDPVQECLIAKGQPAIGYNYIYPDGIVQKHKSKFDAIYPVYEITQDESKNLLKHANKYFENNPEIDPGERKDCVLQVVTTKRDPFARNWFTENILDNSYEHVTLRLIEPSGKVYSFGAKLPIVESTMVFDHLPFTFAATANANITTVDYEESRRFEERRVTSIPLTLKRKEAILEYVNKTNREGIRFNYLRQNCNKFGQVVLGIAGVEVNTRISAMGLFWRMLPSVTRLPVAGPVFRLANKVCRAVGSIFNKLANLIPSPVKWFFSKVKLVVTFVPCKIGTLFLNTLVMILGASKKTMPLAPPKVHESTMQDNRLSPFNQLIDTFSEFFDDEKSDSYVSALMVEWQKKQKSTHIFTYDKPQMYMLPPHADNAPNPSQTFTQP